jgi:hypothetical protein
VRNCAVPKEQFNTNYMKLYGHYFTENTRARLRLLGAGLANLANESKSYQSELFETTNEKERKLEKLIVDINKKHPTTQLKRGRSWLIDKE